MIKNVSCFISDKRGIHLIKLWIAFAQLSEQKKLSKKPERLHAEISISLKKYALLRQLS